MAARDDLITEIRERGVSLRDKDSDPVDPLNSVIIVGIRFHDGDAILVTANWMEDNPSSFVFHRVRGRIRETRTGWSLGEYELDKMAEAPARRKADYDSYKIVRDRSTRKQQWMDDRMDDALNSDAV